MANVDLSREELEHAHGDMPDTAGPMGRLGLFDMTRNAYRVRVRFGAQLVFCEVYAIPGEPIEVHWMCPRCGPLNDKRMSRISSRSKQIEFSPVARIDDGGRLNVEAFTCPWELESKGRRMEFGLGMCGLTIAIDNSVAKYA